MLDNRLSGSLPSELGRLTQLGEGVFSSFYWSGLRLLFGKRAVLSHMNILSFFLAEGLGIGYNDFTGTLPEEFCILRMEKNVNMIRGLYDPRNPVPCGKSLLGGAQCPYLECCPSCPPPVVNATNASHTNDP